MSKFRFLVLLCFCLLRPALAQTGAAQTGAAQTAALPSPSAPPVVSNASAADLRAIASVFARLERAAAARDANALRFFGVTATPTGDAPLLTRTRLTHIAAASQGALVRQEFWLGTTQPDADSGTLRPLASGVQDLWLARSGGALALTTQRWSAPDDAVAALDEAARQEWSDLPPAPVSTDGAVGEAPPILLHLVAEWRGGRWIALRRSRWEGRVLDTKSLASRDREAARDSVQGVALWLSRSMSRFENRAAGTVHFFLQRGAKNWVGLDAVWEPKAPGEVIPHTAEAEAIEARRRVLAQGWASAQAHRDLGDALARIELWAEASDELQKAEALQPGTVPAFRLREVGAQRDNDPQILAAKQLQDEAKVGLGPEHPRYVIQALRQRGVSQTEPLTALRLGLEYSKLADDVRADKWLQAANALLARGVPAGRNASEAAWVQVLRDHLQERQKWSSSKPPNVVRSALFTVRTRLNDLQMLPMLAALESAEHTVYADFGIPMGSTEVVLWLAQGEFQNYTSHFADQPTSEFVAALTLTKLIETETGPLVLGEEVNAFVDPRADLFSTIAHEYGHVAVRQLSRGRWVPVWFNEGIASAVEGGYEGYLPRVRAASRLRALLSLREMQAWNVDGERAFLAYSQANSIIDFIVDKWGHDAVLEILRRIGRDVPPDEAMKQVLRLSPQELWSAWAREGIR